MLKIILGGQPQQPQISQLDSPYKHHQQPGLPADQFLTPGLNAIIAAWQNPTDQHN